MSWTKFIIQGIIIWFLQLLLSDILAIDTIRPDFCVILILYWSIEYGRTVGIISGFLLGILFDFSGTGLFFGLSPLIYTVTGYLSGGLKIIYPRLNSFYFNLFWVLILIFHFFLYCIVVYQDLWELNIELFFGKWLGTYVYTLSFASILQFIYPLNLLADVKSR
tara:strand:+ start:59 stop:550 length:492 start_codon:yes stop_codon:yes gene_type:complete